MDMNLFIKFLKVKTRTRSAVRISDRDRDIAVAVNRDAITATSFDNVRVPPYILFFLHFLYMNVDPTR